MLLVEAGDVCRRIRRKHMRTVARTSVRHRRVRSMTVVGLLGLGIALGSASAVHHGDKRVTATEYCYYQPGVGKQCIHVP